MNQNLLQAAIYNALMDSQELQALLRGRVFDDVPQGEAFPYVVIGEEESRPWDLDCKSGSATLVTVHAFSRYQGSKEVKDIGAAIYDILHNCRMELDGFSAAVFAHEMQTTMLEGDGVTRHLVTRFRVLTLETEAEDGCI